MAAMTGDFSPLGEGLAALGIPAERVLPLLVKYVEEIELFNPAYGLVKVRDRRELIVKHILDSLAPFDIIGRLLDESRPCSNPRKPQIADVGSGAGLPGIPLAICMPGAEFTLIERMGRRAGFLRDALAVLSLPNVRVEEAEMEQINVGAAGEGLFDLVVFRAFKPLDSALLKDLFRLLAPGGMLAAYKGRRESVEEEMARLSLTGAWEILPVEVPFLDEERHLAIIDKNSK